MAMDQSLKELIDNAGLVELAGEMLPESEMRMSLMVVGVELL